MKIIQKMADDIKDELNGAKEYAEKYLMLKSEGGVTLANRYKEMALDEIKHANYIHEEATNKISDLKGTYTPPVEMEEKWEKMHKEYIEQMAFVKQMLSM